MKRVYRILFWETLGKLHKFSGTSFITVYFTDNDHKVHLPHDFSERTNTGHVFPRVFRTWWLDLYETSVI